MEFFEFASIAEAAFINDVGKNFLWAYLVIGGACFALVYAFEAVALFTIATRAGIKGRWMAFVPFFNTYYIGVVSEKNKIFNSKPKYYSLAAAIVEAVYVALYILYYVAVYLIFSGGYAVPEYTPVVIGSVTTEVLSGYTAAANLPESLNWAWWVCANLQNYVLYWIQFVYLILNVFLLISFFRTYSTPRYVLFAIVSVLLPVKGIMMFAVRNNRGKNYVEYVKEQQQRQYRMYQEYMRNNYNNNGSVYGNDYRANPSQGSYDPAQGGSNSSAPEDPFGGLGKQENAPRTDEGNNPPPADPGDPFGDIK